MNLALNDEDELDFDPQGNSDKDLDDFYEKTYKLYSPNISDFPFIYNYGENIEIPEKCYYIQSNNSVQIAKKGNGEEKNNDIEIQKSSKDCLNCSQQNIIIKEPEILEKGFSQFLQESKGNFNSTDSQTKNKASIKDSNDLLNRKRNSEDSQSKIIANKIKFVTKKKQEHTKYWDDNIMKKMQSILNKELPKIINSNLKEIKYEESLRKFLDKFGELELLNLNILNYQYSNKHYKELLAFNFKEIFSNYTSKQYDQNKNNFNKELIDKLYELKRNELKDNKCILNIVKFLDLKYKDFWKFLAFYLEDYEPKKKVESADECYFRSEKKNNNIYNDREFFLFLLEIIEDFLSKVDDEIEKEEEKEEEKEKYKKKFKEVMKDFHTLS